MARDFEDYFGEGESRGEAMREAFEAGKDAAREEFRDLLGEFEAALRIGSAEVRRDALRGLRRRLEGVGQGGDADE